jgi:hypothetical protein
MIRLPKAVALMVFSAVFLFGGKDRDWQTGKVLDSLAARTYIQTGASTTATTSGGLAPYYGAGSSVSSNTRIDQTAIQDTQLWIVGSEYSYVVNDSVQKAVGVPTHGIIRRSIANRKHGCRFVVGDEIKYSQEKANIYVLDPDGKVCKLDILRQERVQHQS